MPQQSARWCDGITFGPRVRLPGVTGPLARMTFTISIAKMSVMKQLSSPYCEAAAHSLLRRERA